MRIFFAVLLVANLFSFKTLQAADASLLALTFHPDGSVEVFNGNEDLNVNIERSAAVLVHVKELILEHGPILFQVGKSSYTLAIKNSDDSDDRTCAGYMYLDVRSSFVPININLSRDSVSCSHGFFGEDADNLKKAFNAKGEELREAFIEVMNENNFIYAEHFRITLVRLPLQWPPNATAREVALAAFAFLMKSKSEWRG